MTPQQRTMTEDQKFLLLFIIGTYFGPDLITENRQKPALQRRAEGLPQYTIDDLTQTVMKTCITERVYYYVLRMANPTVLVKLPCIRHFVKGNMFTHNSPTNQYRQFTDLFPTDLHPQGQFRDRHKTVGNIVFIDNPDTYYIKPEDMERFKSLTGLDHLKLDREAALNACVGVGTMPPARRQPQSPRSPMPPAPSSSGSPKGILVIYDHLEGQAPLNSLRPSSSASKKGKHVNDHHLEDQAPLNTMQPSSSSSLKGKQVNCDYLEGQAPPNNTQPSSSCSKKRNYVNCDHHLEGQAPLNCTQPSASSSEKKKQVNYDHQPEGQAPANITPLACLPAPPMNIGNLGKVEAEVLLLPEKPAEQEWNNITVASKDGIELVGTAAARQSGPMVGGVDIGVSSNAYFFRVSLPGVKRNSDDFSLRVEADGRVVINGVTETGEKHLYRNNQMFRMRTENLCPSGPFTVSFKLPGPVKSCEVIANFERGILEGIVPKA